MATLSEGSSAELLIQSLQDAFKHSQHINELLHEQARIIDVLRLENVRLQNEVAALHSKAEANETYRSGEPQISILFKENMEKQAEIDRLKSKIQRTRNKANKSVSRRPRPSGVQISSDSPTIEFSSPHSEPLYHVGMGRPTEAASTISTVASPVAKTCHSNAAAHLGSTPSPRKPLQASNANHGTSVTGPTQKKRIKSSWHRVDAAELLGEVDESRDRAGNDHAMTPSITMKHDQEPYQRLDQLLNGPTTGHKKLEQSTNATTNLTKTTQAQTEEHTGNLDPPIDVDFGTRIQEGGRHQIRHDEGSQPTVAEDDEPLRCRPLHRLDLSHFKINPQLKFGCRSTRKEIGRSDNANWSPSLTKGNMLRNNLDIIAGSLQPLSEIEQNKILLELLGTGAADEIRSLTPTARENILHKAYVDGLVIDFEKVHKVVQERPQSPVNFWSTDMPDTQEERTSHEHVRLAERRDVERRYQDACAGTGIWVFSDE